MIPLFHSLKDQSARLPRTKVLSMKPFSKRTLWPFIAGLLVFIAIFVWLSIRSSKQWEGVVVESFNKQQLAIARSIAGRLENYFSWAKEYLELYTVSHYQGISQHPRSVLTKMSRYHVAGICLIFPHKAKELVLPGETWATAQLTEREKYYLTLHNKGEVYISNTYQKVIDSSLMWVVDIVVFSEKAPVIWTLDVVKICREMTSEVRSGKTGYAWIINKQGYFLAHIDKPFIGENAFTARARKYPAISFTRIHILQKEYMLTGKEGTSWYTSGWQRGERSEPIKKLIAYTPAHYSGPGNKNKFWSVAISSPEEEVEGLVRGAVIYQWLLMLKALFILVIVAGYAFYTKSRWAQALEKEVNIKAEELKKIHRELLRSERLTAMGSAVAHVAHEIKNPLHVIGGFGNQLLESVGKDEKARKKLQIILEEVQRLDDFVKDIGQFAKDPESKRKHFDLNVLADEVVALFEPDVASLKVAVNLDLAKSPLLISANQDQMKQVLINITKNSLEAMPEGGLLTFRTHHTGSHAVVEISDTGTGIPSEISDKIFNHFFTSKHQGTGLGLSICHKIIAAHEGQIFIRSEGQGRGATVTIELPLAPMPDPC